MPERVLVWSGLLLAAVPGVALLVGGPPAFRGPAAAFLGLALLWLLAARRLWLRPLERLRRAVGRGGEPPSPWALPATVLEAAARSEEAARARLRSELEEARRRLEKLRAHYQAFFQGALEATEETLRTLREEGGADRRQERLLRSLHDLWELGRLPVFPPVPPEDRVDLNFLATQILNTSRPYFQRKQLTVRRSFPPPDAALEVHADIVHIHKGLMTLLAQAYHDARPGTAVSVRLAARGRTAELAVTYTGPAAGAREALAALRPGPEGRAGRRRLLGGGPVLALVAAIARHYRGTLRLRTGAGTTSLALTLPLAAPAAADRAA